MRLRLLALAAGILLVADAVLLTGVAAARRGAPEAELRLTGRELMLPPVRSEENSALVVWLNWRGEPYGPRAEPLDTAKLAALGFDTSSRRPAAKSVYMVLELRPDAPEGQSRLARVDAGRDAALLRGRYPDRRRYAIAAAVARTWWNPRTPPRGSLALASPAVYVPPEYMPVFRQPGYQVSLCYDRNGDPWICGAGR